MKNNNLKNEQQCVIHDVIVRLLSDANNNCNENEYAAIVLINNKPTIAKFIIDEYEDGWNLSDVINEL
jgi:hypothetical protein